MKTIGLLGGTGWSSTIDYYRILNELVGERLGGYHSAKILLKSVDYHEIMSNYGKDHDKVAAVLKRELLGLIALKPDCLIVCCSSLHKYYNLIKADLYTDIPVFHALELVADEALNKNYKKLLLLATKFTMEDGFFQDALVARGLDVVIPNLEERNQMKCIHEELMKNVVTQASRDCFSNLIARYKECDTVILGCTEYPLVVNQESSVLPILDPVFLQARAAVDFATN